MSRHDIARSAGRKKEKKKLPRGRPPKDPVEIVYVRDHGFTFTPEGGKTKCTDAMIKSISDDVGSGMYVDRAVTANGITRNTYYHWLKRGAEDLEKHIESQFSKFVVELDIAHAACERDLLDEIYKASANKAQWQNFAWILERTRNQRFGQKQEIVHKSMEGGPELPPEPPSTYSEWLERREARELQAKAMDAQFEEVES